MEMLRCYSGHFVISAKKFRELESLHGLIADLWCAGCKEMVPIDSHDNLIAAGYEVS
jgi:hypothetical protein